MPPLSLKDIESISKRRYPDTKEKAVRNIELSFIDNNSGALLRIQEFSDWKINGRRIHFDNELQEARLFRGGCFQPGEFFLLEVRVPPDGHLGTWREREETVEYLRDVALSLRRQRVLTARHEVPCVIRGGGGQRVGRRAGRGQADDRVVDRRSL